MAEELYNVSTYSVYAKTAEGPIKGETSAEQIRYAGCDGRNHVDWVAKVWFGVCNDSSPYKWETINMEERGACDGKCSPPKLTGSSRYHPKKFGHPHQPKVTA